MPELPDVEAYVAAVAERMKGQPLLRVALRNPFLLRTAEPPLSEAEGRRVVAVRRLGKRVVLALEGGIFLSLHLMIAGRLHWREPVSVRAKVRPEEAGPERAEGTGGGVEPLQVDLAGRSSPTARWRACSRRTGRGRWRSWSAIRRWA